MENPDAQNVAAATADKVFSEQAGTPTVETGTAPSAAATPEPAVTAETATAPTAPEAGSPTPETPPAEAATAAGAERYYTQTAEYQNQQQQENAQKQPIVPPKKPFSRFAVIGAIVGAILGVTAIVLTFKSRSRNSLIDATKKAELFTVGGTNATERMTDLHGKANGRIDEKTRQGFFDKIQASVKKISNNLTWSSEHEEPLARFAKHANPGPVKNNGILPSIAGALGTGGIGNYLYVGFIEGNSGKRASIQNPKVTNKLDKLYDGYSDKVYHQIGKEDENIKIGAKNHAKNGIIAGARGLVTMGATMAISHFMEKWDARRQEANYAQQVLMDRQIAMIQPQTHISMQ
ncbi:MAG: hypothetical protein P8P30_05450 [Rickettsiales bacterium]|nr:hypothetical protein [Rickettsiales bacterium]